MVRHDGVERRKIVSGYRAQNGPKRDGKFSIFGKNGRGSSASTPNPTRFPVRNIQTAVYTGHFFTVRTRSFGGRGSRRFIYLVLRNASDVLLFAPCTIVSYLPRTYINPVVGLMSPSRVVWCRITAVRIKRHAIRLAYKHGERDGSATGFHDTSCCSVASGRVGKRAFFSFFGCFFSLAGSVFWSWNHGGFEKNRAPETDPRVMQCTGS